MKNEETKTIKLYDIITMMTHGSGIKKRDEKWTKEDMDNFLPPSIYKITLCFMCEEETWINTFPSHPILKPFYDLECYAFFPKEDDTLEVWIKDESFIKIINNEV